MLTGQFNLELQGRLLVRPEEATFGGDPTRSEPLKDFITGCTLRVEPKGVESYIVPNYARVLMTANPSYAIAAGPSERRYCVLTPSKARQKDDSWFGPILEQLDNGGYERCSTIFCTTSRLTGGSSRDRSPPLRCATSNSRV